MATPSLLISELDELRRMVENFETVKHNHTKAETDLKQLQDLEQGLISQGKELDQKIANGEEELPSQQSQQKVLLEKKKQLEQQIVDPKPTQPELSELNNRKQANEQELVAVNKVIEGHAALRQSRSQIDQQLVDARAKIALGAAQLAKLTPQLELAERNKQEAMRLVLDAGKTEVEKIFQHQDALTKRVWLGMLQDVLKDNGITPEKFRELSDQRFAREWIDTFSRQITEIETTLTPEELSGLDIFRKLPHRLSELENSISQSKRELERERGGKEELEQEITNLSQKLSLSPIWKRGLDIAKWLAIVVLIVTGIGFFSNYDNIIGIVAVASLISVFILFFLRWYWDIEARQADANASIQTHKERIRAIEASLNKFESESISSKQKLNDVLARHPDLRAFLTVS
jgi:hypothetical protein